MGLLFSFLTSICKHVTVLFARYCIVFTKTEFRNLAAYSDCVHLCKRACASLKNTDIWNGVVFHSELLWFCFVFLLLLLTTQLFSHFPQPLSLSPPPFTCSEFMVSNSLLQNLSAFHSDFRYPALGFTVVKKSFSDNFWRLFFFFPWAALD